MKEQVKLGQLLGTLEGRDAVHVAVLPCRTNQELRPGQHVGIIMTDDGTSIDYIAVESSKPVGIIDPFLSHPVRPKHRFYVMLYPNTITSLRHDWTHPIIDGENK